MPDIMLTLNEVSKIVSISGLSAEDVKIDYSADIDFTPLVERLIENLATDSSFNLQFTFTENHNEKDKLIAQTIREIIEKYNEIVVATPEDADGDSL